VRVDAAASSVGEALALLWKECPALRDRLLTELGDVRPHVNVFVDGATALRQWQVTRSSGSGSVSRS
jgi:hypothetical protein